MLQCLGGAVYAPHGAGCELAGVAGLSTGDAYDLGNGLIDLACLLLAITV
jgi:hypothetical protein